MLCSADENWSPSDNKRIAKKARNICKGKKYLQTWLHFSISGWPLTFPGLSRMSVIFFFRKPTGIVSTVNSKIVRSKATRFHNWRQKSSTVKFSHSKGKVRSGKVAFASQKVDCSSAERHRQEPAFIICHSQRPHTRTLDTAAMQQLATTVCGNMVSTPVIHAITWSSTHLQTLEEWKAELADRQQTVYPHSGHLSTTDWAKARESPSARGQRDNQWATPPVLICNCNSVLVTHYGYIFRHFK